tara:strand:+ start:5477 stop:6022 length:546 start_codon:yes stop_codon:yes gene_type:complete
MNMTNREWLIKNLPRDIFNTEGEWLKCKNNIKNVVCGLDSLDSDHISKFKLGSGFVWGETDQGDDYWGNIDEKWQELNGYDEVEARECYNKIMSDMDETLSERGGRYGLFKDNARVTQEALAVFMKEPQWGDLSPTHKEFFHMTLHKMSRMICGDPNYVDNPHDIAGYAKLLEDELKEKTE